MKDKFVTEIFSIEDCDRVKSQSIKNMLVEILQVGANIKNIQTDFIFDHEDDQADLEWIGENFTISCIIDNEKTYILTSRFSESCTIIDSTTNIFSTALASEQAKDLIKKSLCI